MLLLLRKHKTPQRDPLAIRLLPGADTIYEDMSIRNARCIRMLIEEFVKGVHLVFSIRLGVPKVVAALRVAQIAHCLFTIRFGTGSKVVDFTLFRTIVRLIIFPQQMVVFQVD